MNINMILCFTIIVILHFALSNDDHSKNEYDGKSTSADKGLKLNSLIDYLIKILYIRNDRLNQYDLSQTNSDSYSYINEFLNEQNSRHSSEIGSFDVSGNFPVSQSSGGDGNSQGDMPSFGGNNNNVFGPSLPDITEINRLFTFRGRYTEYGVSPTSPVYPSLVSFIVLAYVVSYTPNTCDLADTNTIPTITRIQRIKEVPFFKDLSNDDLSDLLNALYVSYEASVPRSYILKPFETTPDCSELVPPQTELFQIFVLPKESVSLAELAESAKTFCVKSKEFGEAYVSYKAHARQPGFISQIDQSIRQVGDVNDPNHSSATPLSDVARLLMSNSQTSKILIASHQARNFAICRLRRAFHLTNINSDDYQRCVEILNQNKITPSIATNSSTSSTTSSSTTERQNGNNTNSTSNSTTSTIITTSSTTLSHSAYTSERTKNTTDEIKSNSSTSSYNSQSSNAKSAKLSSLQVGLICTGVIACILVLVAVAIFVYRKKSQRQARSVYQ